MASSIHPASRSLPPACTWSNSASAWAPEPLRISVTGPDTRSAAGAELLCNCFQVEYAASPAAAADLLQGRPQARLGWQGGVGRQVAARGARRKRPRAFLHTAIHHQTDRAPEVHPVDHDFDEVAFL